ncbi:MAG: sulfatase [Bryobacterales bacterium]|nr:sulfatase [Bryobacterales bacterium]
MKKHLWNAALYGCAAWLAYGAIELTLSAGIQLFHNPEMVLLAWQWPLIAKVFLVYAVAGLVCGAAAGAVLAFAGFAKWPGDVEASACLTLLLAFVVNLALAWPLARSEQLALALAVLLALALVASLFSERLYKQMRGLTSPFAASLLVLSIPWISREALGVSYSAASKTGLALLAAFAIACAAHLKRRMQGSRTPTALSHAVAAAAVLLMFVTAAALRSRAPVFHAEAPKSPAATGKPNVVLVTMDTVRADHTSLYGYSRDTTPKLREFAAAATLYTYVAATSDYTFPTHASIFSGRYPDWQGVVWPDVLPGNITTLTELLRSNGYWTTECVANYAMLGPRAGFAKGFAITDWRRAVPLSTQGNAIADRRHPYYLREAAIRVLGSATNTDYFVRYTRTASDINQCAGAMLDEAAASRSSNFFLFVNYMDAHAAYIPDAPFDTLFPACGPPLRAASYRRIKDEVNSGKRMLESSEKERLISQYDGGIAEIDSAINGLLGKLRALGLFENTVVIITADHGEAFGERGLLEHKMNNLNQELIFVPLIVKYPAQHAARRSDQLVSQVDLMPTILDVARIPPPAPLEGRSLLAPAPSGARDVFAETAGLQSRRAILSGSLKLIASPNGAFELYNLASDPEEKQNLYSPANPEAVELRNKLEAWLAARPRGQAPATKLDPASVERLKSLGYVQ